MRAERKDRELILEVQYIFLESSFFSVKEGALSLSFPHVLKEIALAFGQHLVHRISVADGGRIARAAKRAEVGLAC